MCLSVFSKVAQKSLFSLLIVFMPLSCFGYVVGDMNSDNKIGLEEAIYSLKVVAGASIPLSGTTINVPADIPTIQQAIDAASNGDTINIAANTYHENLFINGKVLTLSGAGSATTIIDGTIDTVTNHAIMIEHSPGVAINNLTVQNGKKGIYAFSNSHVEIDQVVVKDCSDRGIQIDTNSDAEIANSTIENNGRAGIGLLRNSNIYITGTVSTQNNTDYGLQLFLGSTALIDAATFTSSGNSTRGISLSDNSGLYVNSSNISLLDNNTDGLQASGSCSVGVSNDSSITVEDSDESGIAIFGASRLYSAGTIIIRRSGYEGMIAAGSSELSFDGNVLSENNSGSGIIIVRTSSIYMAAQIQVLNCATEGFVISRGSSAQNSDSATIIVQNTTGDGIGISVWGNSIWRAQGGTFDISSNAGTGIEAGRNSTLSFRDRGNGLNATVSGNAAGIQLYQQGSLRTDVGLSVTANTGVGVGLYQGSDAILRNISITNNGSWGVNVDERAGINITNSTIQGNGGGNDINLAFGSTSSLSGNTAGLALTCDGTVLSRGDVVCP